MNSQQTKTAVAAAAVFVLLGGLFALNKTVLNKEASTADASGEMEGADVRTGRLSLNGRGAGAGGSDPSAGGGTKNGRGKSGSGSASGDSGLASIVDAATTQVLPIETEAQTRDREKYEQAMANQFKYRKLDPEKIKPTEVGPALQATSEKYGLPDNLLAAMMYVESGGAHRDGDHSMEAGYGVMNLKENNMVDTAAEAASLIGKTKEEVLYDQKLNIEAAGALLKSYYEDAIASGLSEAEAYYSAVSMYSGRPDPELAAALADETAGWLLKGFELHLSDGGGDMVVPPSPNPVFLPKNWELVGMNPPGAGSGPRPIAGTTPPNAQGYGSATGGAKVSP